MAPWNKGKKGAELQKIMKCAGCPKKILAYSRGSMCPGCAEDARLDRVGKVGPTLVEVIRTVRAGGGTWEECRAAINARGHKVGRGYARSVGVRWGIR